MKKLFYFLLLLILPLSSTRAQTPVIDPAAIASAIVSFLQSLEQAVETTEKVAKGLTKADTTIKRLQAIRDVYDKVNPYIQNMQAIRDVSYNIYNTAETAKATYEAIRKSKYWTPSEASYMLDRYTSLLTSMNNDVLELTDLIKNNAWKMTDMERRAEIKRKTDELHAKNLAMSSEMLKVMLTEKNRRDGEEMFRRGQISTLTWLGMHRDVYCTETPLSLDMAQAFSAFDMNSFENYYPGSGSTGEIASVDNEHSGNYSRYGDYFKFGKIVYNWFCVAMIVIGLLRVLRKVLANEDFVETVMIWFFAVLSAYGISELLNVFFFGNLIK